MEFLKSLWGLGTEEEQGFRTVPPGYMAGGIHSLESMPGPHKHLKVRALAVRYENPIPPRCLAPIDFLKIPALSSQKHRPT
jgi:hypothetical protein